MRVALLSSAKTKKLSIDFYQKCSINLSSNSVNLVKVIVDNGGDKKNKLIHLVNLTKRQCRINGQPFLLHFLNIIGFIILQKLFREHDPNHDLNLKSLEVQEVSSPNEEEFIKIIKENDIDVVCLLGTRIISKNTLKALNRVMFLNIHSSDPSLFRGQPAFFWEVLNGHPTVQLTVHEAVSKLDSGLIFNIIKMPLEYNRSLFKTLKNCERNSVGLISDLFEKTLIELQEGTARTTSYDPGELKTTPTLFELIKAKRVCLKKGSLVI